MTKCRRCTCPNVADQFAIDDPAGDAAGTPYPGQMDAVSVAAGAAKPLPDPPVEYSDGWPAATWV